MNSSLHFNSIIDKIVRKDLSDLDYCVVESYKIDKQAVDKAIEACGQEPGEIAFRDFICALISTQEDSSIDRTEDI